jgi:hypothetical protein
VRTWTAQQPLGKAGTAATAAADDDDNGIARCGCLLLVLPVTSGLKRAAKSASAALRLALLACGAACGLTPPKLWLLMLHACMGGPKISVQMQDKKCV